MRFLYLSTAQKCRTQEVALEGLSIVALIVKYNSDSDTFL